MTWALVIMVGYVLGSVPAASITASRHGIDLARTGDGNPGAWNALEQLGWRRAWPAFAGDALKGTVPGVLGHVLLGWEGAYAGVAAAMVGHAVPVFARGRGGKAVMTFVGGMFACALLPALIALAACVVVALGARSFARGAQVGIFGFPLVQLVLDPVAHVAATGALMCLFGAFFLVRRRPAPRAAA